MSGTAKYNLPWQRAPKSSQDQSGTAGCCHWRCACGVVGERHLVARGEVIWGCVGAEGSDGGGGCCVLIRVIGLA